MLRCIHCIAPSYDLECPNRGRRQRRLDVCQLMRLIDRNKGKSINAEKRGANIDPKKKVVIS